VIRKNVILTLFIPFMIYFMLFWGHRMNCYEYRTSTSEKEIEHLALVILMFIGNTYFSSFEVVSMA
jgi:hypothetical protein